METIYTKSKYHIQGIGVSITVSIFALNTEERNIWNIEKDIGVILQNHM